MRVNDIFYSLQGEGFYTGRAAVFVRFSGCNESCPFCDTDFSAYRDMTGEEIVQHIAQWPSRFIVLTGGEPSLQVDEAFIDLLHRHGYQVAMETNGTRPLPPNLDWSTVSPKGATIVKRCNEVKLLYAPNGSLWFPDPAAIDIEAEHYFLQPCDTGHAEETQQAVNACVEYIKQHPRWRLSLQTHKLAKFK